MNSGNFPSVNLTLTASGASTESLVNLTQPVNVGNNLWTADLILAATLDRDYVSGGHALIITMVTVPHRIFHVGYYGFDAQSAVKIISGHSKKKNKQQQQQKKEIIIS